MAAKPFVAARIPEELHLKLDEYSKITSESRTQILINALSTYIGYFPTQGEKESSSDRLSRLEAKVTELECILKEPKRFLLVENSKSEPEPEKTVIPETQFNNTSDNRVEKEAVQGVIDIENNTDNILDDNTDNKSDNIQIAIIDEVIHHPDSQYGEYLGKLKTKEVMDLPELKVMDIPKLRNKLTGIKRLKARRDKIGSYVLFLTLLDKENSKKQEFLWHVYKTENT